MECYVSDSEAGRRALDVALARFSSDQEYQNDEDIFCVTVSNTITGKDIRQGDGVEVSRFNLSNPRISWKVMLQVDVGDNLRVVMSELYADDMSRLRVRGDVQFRPHVYENEVDDDDFYGDEQQEVEDRSERNTVVVLGGSGTIASVNRSSVEEMKISVTTFYYHPQRQAIERECVDQLRQDLDVLRADQESADTVLVVGGVPVRAHRAVLGARSPLLRQLLCQDEEQVILADVDHELFLKLLRFVYTADLRALQGCEGRLLVLARRLQIQDLVDACCQLLLRDLREDNALRMLTFADEQDVEELKESAAVVVVEHLESVTSSQEWQLYKERLSPPSSLLLETAARLLKKP